MFCSCCCVETVRFVSTTRKETRSRQGQENTRLYHAPFVNFMHERVYIDMGTFESGFLLVTTRIIIETALPHV